MFIKLSRAYFCPEDHITDNPYMCGCGNTNLFPLQPILNRESTSEEEKPYEGICCDNPAIKEMFN